VVQRAHGLHDDDHVVRFFKPVEVWSEHHDKFSKHSVLETVRMWVELRLCHDKGCEVFWVLNL
jgi:hypothetical protein